MAMVPDGFLRFSDAVHRLTQGVWGGLRRPELLGEIDPKNLRGGGGVFTLPDGEKWAVKPEGRGSIGFGPWKETAGRLLTKAANEGKLKVYIFSDNQTEINESSRVPLILSTAVVSKMIRSRGSLPDHAIRPSLRLAGGSEKLFKLLKEGVLLVHVEEFNKWYRSERAKRIWASQRSRSKPKRGRPSKQTDDALRNAVLNALREKRTSVAELRRRLVACGRTDVPSVDTLERLVEQLQRETGRSELYRVKRVRRKPLG